MKVTSLKAKSGGAINAARSESNRTGTLVSDSYNVKRPLWPEWVKRVWRKEATRLCTKYQRTGNPAHLKAFRIHRAAMGGRLHGEAAIS